MDRYTVYCTEEQTMKALELGAPIKINSWPPINGEKFMWLSPPKDAIAWDNSTNCLIPTAEQMLGWLREEHNIHISIFSSIWKGEEIKYHYAIVQIGKTPIGEFYTTYSEAILTSIDKAFNYFIQNKQ